MIGDVQYVKDVAGSVDPSGLYVLYEFDSPWPWRSPYRPLSIVRLSFAVWGINGVWVFEEPRPLLWRKLSRCGICSRSDGTFGLAREKWTLSKTMLITCETPLPSWQGAALPGCAGRPSP